MMRQRSEKPPRFRFESGTVSLPTGAIFRPARNAVDRWVVEQPAFFAALGNDYHCLYQTADDRFVYVCALVSTQGFGSVEEIREARVMTDDEARRFLLQNELDLPECLAEGLPGFLDVPEPEAERAEDDAEDANTADPAKGDGVSQGVAIVNWHEGGKAFAEAFMGVGGGSPSNPVTPTAIADRLEGLIREAEEWMEPRPRAIDPLAPYPEKYRKQDEEVERMRQNIASAGDAIKLALVKFGESAGPLLSLLNWIADKDPTTARDGWPTVKVSLQETALRLRLRDDADAAPPPAGSAPANADERSADTDTTDDEPDPKAPYMPAEWFKDEFGLTADALRGQARRQNLATMKRGRWNLYSVPDARRIWPQTVTYGPDTHE